MWPKLIENQTCEVMSCDQNCEQIEMFSCECEVWNVVKKMMMLKELLCQSDKAFTVCHQFIL